MSNFPTLTETLERIELPLTAFDVSLGDIGALQSFTNGILVKEFTSDIRNDGSFAAYHFRLAADSPVGTGLKIPGLDGYSLLVTSPDIGSEPDSGFNINIQLEWRLISILNLFSAENFSFSPEAFFEAFLKMANLEPIRLLERLAEYNTAGRDKDSFLKYFNHVLSGNLSNPIEYLPNGFPSGESFEESMETLFLEIEEKNDTLGIVDVLFTYFSYQYDGEDLKRELSEVFKPYLGFEPYEFLKELLIPRVGFSSKMGIGLRVPQNVLKRVQPLPAPPPETGQDIVVDLGEVDFEYRSGKNGYTNFNAVGSVNVPESYILNSAIKIKVINAKLDLNPNSNFPDGGEKPPGFIGLFIQECTLGLPSTLFGEEQPGTNAVIKGTNVLVGTGGITGKFSLGAQTGPISSALLKFEIGGFKLDINLFELSVRQNVIESSSIKGDLWIKFGGSDAKKVPIEIGLSINDGSTDFSISGDFSKAAIELDIKGKVKVGLQSLKVFKKGSNFFAKVGGQLNFNLGKNWSNNFPKNLAVQMTIGSDGSFSFDGGKLVLPKTLKFKLGPVDMCISGLTLGTEERGERKYAFLGFDGSIAVSPGSNKVDGKGIRVYFTVDNGEFDCFLYMQSLAIELQIPSNVTPDKAALIVKGFLEMPDRNQNPMSDEYKGSVSFQLPKMKIAGGAAMRYSPKTPAMVVDAFVDLPSGIPLGGTGISIFGFRGLFGTNYAVSKKPEQEWWDWYSKPSMGLDVKKMAIKKGRTAIGLGATAGTTPDSGYTFSMALLVYLGLPDVFLINGQGDFLGPRISNANAANAPLQVLMVITEQSIYNAIGFNLALPKQSATKLVKLQGLVEMEYFFGKPKNWYINLGRENPVEKQIKGSILDFLTVSSFLEMRSYGMKLGVSSGFKRKYGFSQASVDLALEMGGRAEVCYSPFQAGGYIQVLGDMRFKFFWLNFFGSILARLQMEGPQPIGIEGEFSAEVSIKILWKKKGFKFTIKFGFHSGNSDELKLALPILPVTDAIDGKPTFAKNVSAVHMLSNDSYRIYNQIVADSEMLCIPSDSFIDIAFDEMVLPDGVKNSIGGAWTPAEDAVVMTPPVKGISPQVKHNLEVTSISVKYLNGTGYSEYKPYEMVPVINGLLNGASPPLGYWQLHEPNRYNKIRLMATNPFTFVQQMSVGSGNADSLGFDGAGVFCQVSQSFAQYIDWEAESIGKWAENTSGKYSALQNPIPSENPDLKRYTYTHESTGVKFTFEDVRTFDVSANDNSVEGFRRRLGITQDRKLFIDTSEVKPALTEEELNEFHINDFPPEAKLSFGQLNKVKFTLKLLAESVVIHFKLKKRLPYQGYMGGAGSEIEKTITKEYTRKELEIASPPYQIEFSDPDYAISGIEIESLSPHNSLNAYPLCIGSAWTYNNYPYSPKNLKGQVEDVLIVKGLYPYPDNYEPAETNPYQDAVFKDTILNAAQIIDPLTELTGPQIKKVFGYWPLRQARQNPEQIENGLEKSILGYRPSDSGSTFVQDSKYAGHNYFIEPGGQNSIKPIIPTRSNLPDQRGIYLQAAYSEVIAIADKPEEKDLNRELNFFSKDDFSVSFWVRPEIATGQDWSHTKQVLNKSSVLAAGFHFNIVPGFALGVTDGTHRMNFFIPGIIQEYQGFYSDCPIYDSTTKWYYVNLQIKRDRVQSNGLYFEVVLSMCSKDDQGFSQVYVKSRKVPYNALPTASYLYKMEAQTLFEMVYQQKKNAAETTREQVTKMQEAINKLYQPIWRPDTLFHLEIKFKDTVDATPHEFTKDYYFKTAKPIGHTEANEFSIQEEDAQKKADLLKKTQDISAYIDYERSYPSPDGELNEAKPLYFKGPKVMLNFAKPYLNSMYQNWPLTSTSNSPVYFENNLEYQFFSNPVDGTGALESDVPTIDWAQEIAQYQTPDLVALNSMLTNNNCLGVVGNFTAKTRKLVITPGELKPSQLYLCKVNSRYKKPENTDFETKEIHKFVFQTSRYGSLQEHIKSFTIRRVSETTPPP